MTERYYLERKGGKKERRKKGMKERREGESWKQYF